MNSYEWLYPFVPFAQLVRQIKAEGKNLKEVETELKELEQAEAVSRHYLYIFWHPTHWLCRRTKKKSKKFSPLSEIVQPKSIG